MENILSQKIPTDLLFVSEKYSLDDIRESFARNYAQVIPVTDTQKYLKTIGLLSAEKISRQETFDLYKINEKDLFVIYDLLEKKARESGVGVEYADLSPFSEDDFYKNDHSDDSKHKKHAETARSDGKILLLEKDLVKAGGIQGRIYDLLHLAFGHMVQWSTDEASTLLTKEEAWSIGYRNHEKSADTVISMMSFYEFEAGMQGIEALHQALDESSLQENEKEKILQYFIDYAYADRDYIIQHYRGNHESFQKFWKFAQPIPPRKELPRVSEFITRHAVEIGLIRDKQKQS